MAATRQGVLTQSAHEVTRCVHVDPPAHARCIHACNTHVHRQERAPPGCAAAASLPRPNVPAGGLGTSLTSFNHTLKDLSHGFHVTNRKHNLQ